MTGHAAASLSTLPLVPLSELLKFLPVKDRHALAQCTKQLRQNSLALDPALRAYVAFRALVFDRLGTVPSAEEPFECPDEEDWDWGAWARGDTCKALRARLQALSSPSQLPPGWRFTYFLEDFAQIYEFSEERTCAAVDIPLPSGRKLRVSCLGRRDSDGHAEPEWARFFVQEVGENDAVIVYNVYPGEDQRYNLLRDHAVSALVTSSEKYGISPRTLAWYLRTAFPDWSTEVGYKDPHGSWKQPNDLGHGESESGCDSDWHTSDDEIPGVGNWLSCEEVEQIDVEEVRDTLGLRSDGMASEGVPPFFPHLANYSPELDGAVEALMACDVDQTTWAELASLVNRLHAHSTLDCYPSTVAQLLAIWHCSLAGPGLPAVPSDPVPWAQQNIIYSRWVVDEAVGKLSDGDDLRVSSRSVMEFRVRNAAGDKSHSMKFLAQSANAPGGRKSLDVALFNESGAAVIELALKPEYEKERYPCDRVGTFRMDVGGLAHIRDMCGFEAQWPDAGMFGVLLLAVGFCAWQRTAGLPDIFLSNEPYCRKSYLSFLSYPWVDGGDEISLKFTPYMFKFVAIDPDAVDPDDSATTFSRADTFFPSKWFVAGSA
ncbi:hypothetical protein HDU88_000004 [Geranomyces variabilis]|nr:hypothetical protein HDU88_000004 [Geranomyces variabilis]